MIFSDDQETKCLQIDNDHEDYGIQTTTTIKACPNIEKDVILACIHLRKLYIKV